MRRGLLVFLIFLITAPLWAAVNKDVTWVPPTERVNGDPLPLAEIASYDLECVRTGTGEVIYNAQLAGDDTAHETGAVFDEGEFQCRMRTVDTGGLVSEWGESNVFTVGRCETSDCRPLPPRSINVVL